MKPLLELRLASGADIGSLAEAKGDLGHYLFTHGRKNKGLKLLQEAAAELSASAQEAFASRIKIRLAHAYLIAATMGCGTLFRLGHAVPATGQRLRAIAQHHGRTAHRGIRMFDAEKPYAGNPSKCITRS